MYIESFVVTEERHTIEIPKEFYGSEIEIEIKQKTTENAVSFPKLSDKFYNRINKITDIDAIFEELKNNKYSLPPDYKFDRDEANER